MLTEGDAITDRSKEPQNHGDPIMLEIAAKRGDLLRQLVGDPFPRLWCPPLTHYTADGEIDQKRMAAHWGFMAPHVNSFLVPGSTGDAWEMNARETQTLLELSLRLAAARGSRLLIGVLKEDTSAVRQSILQLLATFRQTTGKDDPIEAMKAVKVCGFTICPPRGGHLTQDTIEAELDQVLELGLPTAIYQLPQITGNEMSPSLVARLAERHANLMLLKDSSGADRVALDADRRSSLILLRGAEGRYAQWLLESGGPYQGLLLSTANCFPRELRTIVTLLEAGRRDESFALSDRLSEVVGRVFALVTGISGGNAFANANKAVDHYMAHGAEGQHLPPPMQHAGTRLPKDVMLRVGEVLAAAQLIPATGYLAG